MLSATASGHEGARRGDNATLCPVFLLVFLCHEGKVTGSALCKRQGEELLLKKWFELTFCLALRSKKPVVASSPLGLSPCVCARSLGQLALRVLPLTSRAWIPPSWL